MDKRLLFQNCNDSGDFDFDLDGGCTNNEDGLSVGNIAFDKENVDDSLQSQLQEEDIPNDINSILDNNLGYPTIK